MGICPLLGYNHNPQGVKTIRTWWREAQEYRKIPEASWKMLLAYVHGFEGIKPKQL